MNICIRVYIKSNFNPILIAGICHTFSSCLIIRYTIICFHMFVYLFIYPYLFMYRSILLQNSVGDFHSKASQATSHRCLGSPGGAPRPKSCEDRLISAVLTYSNILPLNLLPGATNRCEMNSFCILSYADKWNQMNNMKKLHVEDNIHKATVAQSTS